MAEDTREQIETALLSASLTTRVENNFPIGGKISMLASDTTLFSLALDKLDDIAYGIAGYGIAGYVIADWKVHAANPHVANPHVALWVFATWVFQPACKIPAMRQRFNWFRLTQNMHMIRHNAKLIYPMILQFACIQNHFIQHLRLYHIIKNPFMI